MKSISHGHGQPPHQVGHEEDGALEHAEQEQVAAGVVGGDLVAELGDARLQRVLVDEDRPTPRSSSVWRHERVTLTPSALDDARDRDHLVAAHDERPAPRARSAGSWRRRTRPGPSCCGPRAGRRDASRARAGPAASDSIVQSPHSHVARRARPGRARARAARTRAPPARRRRGRRASSRPCAASSSASAGADARQLVGEPEQVLGARPGGAARAAAGSRRGSGRASCPGSSSRRGTRAARPRQYASVSSPQTASSGRTTPSARATSIARPTWPLETSR